MLFQILESGVKHFEGITGNDGQLHAIGLGPFTLDGLPPPALRQEGVNKGMHMQEDRTLFALA